MILYKKQSSDVISSSRLQNIMCAPRTTSSQKKKGFSFINKQVTKQYMSQSLVGLNGPILTRNKITTTIITTTTTNTTNIATNALKAAKARCLQSPHCTANCLQHVD